ncbi:MAG: amino acid permease [Bacteroidetes bacterium]|nr:amino acid permease [Bacteroidota bacterium]MBS1931906.1 amino acid permease [Bacteroidota bacterium]
MDTQNQLNRSLGLRFVIVLVIGNIIGSGVYKKVAPMTDVLHSSGWVLICWLLAGIISLFGALCNAEVAGLLANTGGEYIYYQKIYNKFFAFIFGWSLFTVIHTASISALAYVFAQSINSVIHLPPVLSSWSNINLWGVFHPFQDFNIKIVAIGIIIVLTWINNRGVKAGAGVSTAILLMVITGILLIIAFGLSSSHADLTRPFQINTVDASSVSFSAVFTAMLAAFWGYQGWASIGFIGGEIKEANKNIPKGIAIGVIVIISIYLLINTTYLSLMSVHDIEAINRSGNQIAAVEAVRIFWNNGGVMFISVLIALTTLGCTNATILTGGRIYYAMAGEGMFFSKAARLNVKKVPSYSLLYQGALASLLVLSGTFDQLTDMIIFAVFIFYGATTLGVFILRRKMPDTPRPYKVWGYPVVPALVVLFSATLVINTIYSRPREAAIGTALILAGVPLYFYFVSRLKNKR